MVRSCGIYVATSNKLVNNWEIVGSSKLETSRSSALVGGVVCVGGGSNWSSKILGVVDNEKTLHLLQESLRKILVTPFFLSVWLDAKIGLLNQFVRINKTFFLAIIKSDFLLLLRQNPISWNFLFLNILENKLAEKIYALALEKQFLTGLSSKFVGQKSTLEINI